VNMIAIAQATAGPSWISHCSMATVSLVAGSQRSTGRRGCRWAASAGALAPFEGCLVSDDGGGPMMICYAARRDGTLARQASASRTSSVRVTGRGSSSARARVIRCTAIFVMDACGQDVKGGAPVQ